MRSGRLPSEGRRLPSSVRGCQSQELPLKRFVDVSRWLVNTKNDVETRMLECATRRGCSSGAEKERCTVHMLVGSSKIDTGADHVKIGFALRIRGRVDLC